MSILKRLLKLVILAFVLILAWYHWWHLSKSVFPLQKKVSKANLEFTLASPLPARVTEAGGTSYRDKFYLMGGIDGFGRTTKKFWEFDAETNTWKRLPDIPVPINHPGVVAAHDKIYVVGGFEPIGL